MGTMTTVRYATSCDVHGGRGFAQPRQTPKGDVPEALRTCPQVRRPPSHQDTQSWTTDSRSVLVPRDQRTGVLDMDRRVEPGDRVRALVRPGRWKVRHQGRSPLGVHLDPRTTVRWHGPGSPLPYPSVCPTGPSGSGDPERKHAPVSHCPSGYQRPKDRVRERSQAGGGQRVPAP